MQIWMDLENRISLASGTDCLQHYILPDSLAKAAAIGGRNQPHPLFPVPTEAIAGFSPNRHSVHT